MKAHQNVLELIGNTPLIQLNKVAASLKGNYFAKFEAFNPGQSTKDRIALHIIEIAEQKGVEVLMSARNQGYPLEVKLESN